jgi:hypothetical protein
MVSTGPATPIPKPETKTTNTNPPDAGGADYPPDAGDECPLPELALLVWERDRDGGCEAWHAPQGKRTPRKFKTYLGRVGKRKLVEWESLQVTQRRAAVVTWIQQKRTKKGVA